MTSLWVVFALVFGAVFGSFATVLIARVPDASSIGGRSRCPGCGSQIQARDNIPLLSWLLLRGRCRNCGKAISPMYPLAELLSALLFVLVVLQPLSPLQMLAWLWFAPIAVALVFIDLRYLRLPDVLTYSAVGGALVVLTVDAALASDFGTLRTAVFSSIGLSVFYLLLNIVSRGGMGMGDVKLAFSIGLLTGYLGVAYVIVATFLAFMVGAVTGVALMAMKRAGRKTALPFGPFMLFGTFAALVVTPAFVQYYFVY